MEEELRENVKSPWLLYHDSHDREQVFCSVTHPHHMFRDHDPILWDKQIWNYNHGWLLISAGTFTFSLFNPNTRQVIDLPPLVSSMRQRWRRANVFPRMRRRQQINAGILWLSPEDPMSKVLLFDKGCQTILYCFIHKKKEWIEMSYKLQGRAAADEAFFFFIGCPVNCNGRLYALLFSVPFKILEIVAQEGSYRLEIKPLESQLSIMNLRPWTQENYRWWLAESQGQLFAINIVFGMEDYAREVIDVAVFRLDFNSLEQGWSVVKGSEIKDCAFFLSPNGQPLSCTTAGQEFEGGLVYHTTSGSQILYSYDVEDGSVRMCLPSRSLYPSVWVMMPNSRENSKETSRKKKITIEGSSDSKWINFLDLPCDTMETVAKKIRPVDCMNLRVTCKACCQLARPTWWRTSSTVPEQPHFLPPLLMFSRGDRMVHHFIDMMFGGIFMIEVDQLLYGARMRYSKNGWVLLTNMHEKLLFLFFYNPFTKDVIRLPQPLEPWAELYRFCFTDIPSSPECIVMGVRSGSVCYSDIRKQQWKFIDLRALDVFLGGPSVRNPPIFFKGAFYVLGLDGTLSKLTFGNGMLTGNDKFNRPCKDFCQNFLLEWDGKLASVFINETWMSLQVFTFDETEMLWEEVSSLGRSSFFLSSFSAFAITTNVPEMGNRIYLSKFYGEAIIFYCLKTKRFGYDTGERKINNFDDAKEYLSSCWIQPSYPTA